MLRWSTRPRQRYFIVRRSESKLCMNNSLSLSPRGRYVGERGRKGESLREEKLGVLMVFLSQEKTVYYFRTGQERRLLYAGPSSSCDFQTQSDKSNPPELGISSERGRSRPHFLSLVALDLRASHHYPANHSENHRSLVNQRDAGSGFSFFKTYRCLRAGGDLLQQQRLTHLIDPIRPHSNEIHTAGHRLIIPVFTLPCDLMRTGR